MHGQEVSSDILVIHQNRIIFSSGQGNLTKHSKISATVTQVLTLFSSRIMEGEQIHFIRFENHRMIFLYSQKIEESALVAIVLNPIERSARQVIPAMNIVLHMVEEFLQGNIEDAQNRQLDCFYQILSSPERALFIIPRSPAGVLSALVILTAFAHDMHLGIQQIASNLHFVDPSNPQELQELVQKSITHRILSFVPLPEVEENDNILLFGLDSPLKQYFSTSPGEQAYDVISRVFGDQSNAAKMRKFIANEEAWEIAQSIALLPSSEDNFIRKEILLSTVLQPGRDIIVTLSTPVMQKLRTLASSPVTIEIPTTPIDIENKEVVSQEKVFEEVQTRVPAQEVETHEPAELEIKEVPTEIFEPEMESPTAVELAAEPDAIPQEVQEPISEPIATIPEKVVVTRLDEIREKGFEYQFNSIPLILDTAPYEIDIPENQDLPFDESKITLRLFSGGEKFFIIHIYTTKNRLSDLKDSLEDLSVRIGGETQIKEDHVSIIGPIEKRLMAIRALLWLSIVEYLTQVEMRFQGISGLFDIPNEGSILIIPPNRDFIKDKIPSKFKSFIEETELRSHHEQEELWTLGKVQDDILSRLMEPLKQGDGVVFVASNNNQEMEEIALFLLMVSEICGIGFSRW